MSAKGNNSHVMVVAVVVSLLLLLLLLLLPHAHCAAARCTEGMPSACSFSSPNAAVGPESM
jgi:hypothetical protein